MLQTGRLDWVGPQEVRSGLNLIGTAILEVCQRPEGVTDQSDGLGKATESQIWTYVDFHCNPGRL